MEKSEVAMTLGLFGLCVISVYPCYKALKRSASNYEKWGQHEDAAKSLSEQNVHETIAHARETYRTKGIQE